MNKDYIERPEKFDRAEYNKQHYKNFCAQIKPDLWVEIEKYCKDFNLSKSDFLRRAIEALKSQ